MRTGMQGLAITGPGARGGQGLRRGDGPPPTFGSGSRRPARCGPCAPPVVRRGSGALPLSSWVTLVRAPSLSSPDGLVLRIWGLHTEHARGAGCPVLRALTPQYLRGGWSLLPVLSAAGCSHFQKHRMGLRAGMGLCPVLCGPAKAQGGEGAGVRAMLLVPGAVRVLVAGGCPDIWSNMALCGSMRVFLG